jgi:hypothetical protein
MFYLRQRLEWLLACVLHHAKPLNYSPLTDWPCQQDHIPEHSDTVVAAEGTNDSTNFWQDISTTSFAPTTPIGVFSSHGLPLGGLVLAQPRTSNTGLETCCQYDKLRCKSLKEKER